MVYYTEKVWACITNYRQVVSKTLHLSPPRYAYVSHWLMNGRIKSLLLQNKLILILDGANFPTRPHT